MRLSVATNYDPELVEGLKKHPVVELYGKLRSDSVGGGRAPYQLKKIGKRQLAEHVCHARENNIDFNYLLNASCLGNRELTRKGQKEIDQLLDWVSSIGVAAVTVATPFMLKLVKTRFPHLRVRISLFGGVDRVRKAQMWEELGADCIVLDSILVNRELDTLRQIRKSVSCDLELLVNNNCLMGCALSPSHMNAIAHTGQSWHPNKGFFIDWCFMKCTEMKLQDPVNYIRSEWIRPEDLHIYEDLGYDLFKIVERDLPTPLMLKRVEAYVERSYDGNLLDLIQPYGFTGIDAQNDYYKSKKKLSWLRRYMLRPTLVNPVKMLLLKKVVDARNMTNPIEGKAPVYLDNKALDGFMERFKSTGCRETDCDDCRWCHQFAEKALHVDSDHRDQSLRAYDRFFQAVHEGELWRYTPTKEGCASCSH